MSLTTVYAHQKKGSYFLRGTAACAYPTPNGWAWASNTWAVNWDFTIKTTQTDPRYSSPTAGDLRLDRCFFCGDPTDPRKSAHYESPKTHVPPSSVHNDCVEEYMRVVWTDNLRQLLTDRS